MHAGCRRFESSSFGGNVADSCRRLPCRLPLRYMHSGPRPPHRTRWAGRTQLFDPSGSSAMGWASGAPSERSIEHSVRRARLEASWILGRRERWGRARRRGSFRCGRTGPGGDVAGHPSLDFSGGDGYRYIGAAARAALSGDSVRLLRARWDVREALGLGARGARRSQRQISRPGNGERRAPRPTKRRASAAPARGGGGSEMMRQRQDSARSAMSRSVCRPSERLEQPEQGLSRSPAAHCPAGPCYSPRFPSCGSHFGFWLT